MIYTKLLYSEADCLHYARKAELEGLAEYFKKGDIELINVFYYCLHGPTDPIRNVLTLASNTQINAINIQRLLAKYPKVNNCLCYSMESYNTYFGDPSGVISSYEYIHKLVTSKLVTTQAQLQYDTLKLTIVQREGIQYIDIFNVMYGDNVKAHQTHIKWLMKNGIIIVNIIDTDIQVFNGSYCQYNLIRYIAFNRYEERMAKLPSLIRSSSMTLYPLYSFINVSPVTHPNIDLVVKHVSKLIKELDTQLKEMH